MPIFDFFRNILFGRDPEESKDSRIFNQRSNSSSFRSPIWDMDEDDDFDDFRHSGGTMHFNIYTDPLEITRYFEAQMGSMMKNFFQEFGVGTGSTLFFDNPSINAHPLEPPQQDSLRDKFLKHDNRSSDHEDNIKVDTDLDGRITPDEFSTIWNNTNKRQEIQPYMRSHSFGKSVRNEVYRRADGAVEHKQVIRDSEGNEETTIARELGDKKYVIITKRDKDGAETKTENLINMDESDVKKFTDEWAPSLNTSIKHNSILDTFPWETFFGPNPKL